MAKKKSEEIPHTPAVGEALGTQIAARVPISLRDRLDAYCKSEERSWGFVIRKALEEFLGKAEAKRP